ncbi:MAG: glycosyltransferase family 9 protein [Deltaproteobacteria bacterium]
MGKDLQSKDIKNGNNKSKAAIFFSAGIGDAILMVPLIRELQSCSYQVTIFLNSPFIDIEFLHFNKIPCDQLIKTSLGFSMNTILSYFRKFDFVFLDYSSSSIVNISTGMFISRKLFVHRKRKLLLPGIKFLFEKQETHAAILNLQLFNHKFLEKDFKIDQLKLVIKDAQKPDIILNLEKESKIPIFVQPSAANLTAKYKNWPVEYWIELISRLIKLFPDFIFILAGDKNEIEIGEKISRKIGKSCINLMGNTELTEASKLLFFSKIYLGLDSGFMHLAVAYGIPTFSVFGSSSYDLFGYEKFDPFKNRVIFNSLPCWPCSGYSKRNIKKVKNPKDCPDVECLIKLKPDKVFDHFIWFYKELVSIQNNATSSPIP